MEGVTPGLNIMCSHQRKFGFRKFSPVLLCIGKTAHAMHWDSTPLKNPPAKMLFWHCLSNDQTMQSGKRGGGERDWETGFGKEHDPPPTPILLLPSPSLFPRMQQTWAGQSPRHCPSGISSGDSADSHGHCLWVICIPRRDTIWDECRREKKSMNSASVCVGRRGGR